MADDNQQQQQPQQIPHDFNAFTEQNQRMLTTMMAAYMQAQSPTNSTKLPTPPFYSGNRDATEIDAWIRLIDKHQSHNNWTEGRTFTFASSLLKGRAAIILAHHEDPNSILPLPTTWAELQNIIVSNFRPTNDQDLARDLLVTLRQTTSIRDFVDRFTDAVIPIKQIAESEKCDRFMRGLRDKALVARIRGIPLENRVLDDLFQMALAHEFAHNPEITNGAQVNTNYRPRHTDDDPMELGAILNNHRQTSSNYGGANNNNNRPRRSRYYDPNATCSHCKKPGHNKPDCRARAFEIVRAFDKLDFHTRNKLFKSVGALNCIETVDAEVNHHQSNCNQCHSSHVNKSIGSSYLLSLCDEITDNVTTQLHEIDQLISMIDVNTSNTEPKPFSQMDSSFTASVPTDSADEPLPVVTEDTAPITSCENSGPIELVPIVHDLSNQSTLVDLTTDSVYLTTLLNATNASNLPLYSAKICLINSTDTIEVRCLIDNGASENYISGRIAKIIEGQRSVIHGREVETAGGDISPITEQIAFQLNLQGHTSPISAFVFDTKFDIILGRAWLKQHHPIANWFDDTWTLSCCGSIDVTISPCSSIHLNDDHTPNHPASPELNYLVSHLQMEKILKEEGVNACFLYMVDDSSSSNTGKEISAENIIWTEQLMTDFPTVFQDKLPGLPPNRKNFSHVINVPEGVNPINRPPFRMSPAELDELQRQLAELQSLGLIRPSSSPWGAPVLFVKKKNGEMRMCIDYRALNKVTIRNSTPLPRIDECLDRLQGASWFTCLDLRSGYHQIRLKDSDIPLSGFNTRYGKWEWLVLPFGLSNAPPSYQTWMNGILKDCIDKFALVYLDDCCIFSKTQEEHIQHVRQVLSIFEKEGLIVNLKKCEFGKRELEFLGYRVSAQGILPSLSKVKAVQQWPRPTNVQEVRQFVGLAQHYRRFCPGFSTIAAPLTELTHGNGAKKRAIIWNDQCESSFTQIKKMLTSPPLLKLPDMSKPYRIETDSSNFGVGAVLLQQDSESDCWLPIAYESKKLSKAEQKFPAQERELIAIIHALRTWRCFVDGCKGGYTVYSDHKPLVHYASQLHPTPRLVRWIAEYESFSPNIEYKAGKDNQIADALSRKPDLLLDDGVDIPSLAPEYLYATWSQLPENIKHDWPILYVDNQYTRMPSDVLRKRMEKEKDQFSVRQGTVYKLVKPESTEDKTMELKFVPFSDRAELVFQYHTAYGHAGIKTMLKMITERYWWPGLRKDIHEWLRTCSACQLNSRSDQAHKGVMHPLQIPQAFDRWHLDFVGELPTTGKGNKWLLTAVDYLTNWPIAKAVPVASMEEVADFIYEEIVMRFGCPSEIITDRGANFTSGLVAAYTKRVGINHKLTSAFHPRTNSKVERYNGIIKQMLRKYVNGAIHRWDDFVNAALWASRIRIHSTTGFSPFYLVYGREPRLPGDVLRPYITKQMLLDKRTVADITSRELELLGQHRAAAEFRLKAMSEVDKERWDSKIKPTSFEIGDMVLMTHEGKYGLEPSFKGPYIITKVHPYDTYRLETIAGEPLQSLVNVQRLILAKGGKPSSPWYDPTASRRAVREADRLRLAASAPSSTTPGISTAIHPSININQPQDDFIDMPISSSRTTNIFPELESVAVDKVPATTNLAEINNSTLEEDTSIHGSSVMDTTEEPNEEFEQIVDGYDLISSGGDNDSMIFRQIVDGYQDISAGESDIEIVDSPSPAKQSVESSPIEVSSPNDAIMDEITPNTVLPVVENEGMMSENGSDHPHISNTNTTSNNSVASTTSLDNNLDSSLSSGLASKHDSDIDERVSEPEVNENMLPQEEVFLSAPASPIIFPDIELIQTTVPPPTASITTPIVPANPTPIPITVPAQAKPIFSPVSVASPTIPSTHKWSPKAPSPLKIPATSSSTPNISFSKKASLFDSSKVVQGRTKFSEGGDVSTQGYSDSDIDLQDLIQRLNTNKNKKRVFRPRAPTTRKIKQRLNLVTLNITSILDSIFSK